MIALADLEGRWRLERVIEDARAGLTGRLEGESVWSPDGAGLKQVETGLLSYGAAPPMQASRTYLWREGPDGLAVFFEDGRPFHTVTGRLAARHDCPPDLYDVTYDFSAWPVWESRWRVTGPRKDALIVSRFSRLG